MITMNFQNKMICGNFLYTYVRIPQVLSSTVTIAEFTWNSSILFVAVKIVSDGETVATLKSVIII